MKNNEISKQLLIKAKHRKMIYITGLVKSILNSIISISLGVIIVMIINSGLNFPIENMPVLIVGLSIAIISFLSIIFIDNYKERYDKDQLTATFDEIDIKLFKENEELERRIACLEKDMRDKYGE